MARPGIPIPDDASPPRPRRPMATLLLIALVLSPVIYELGLIVASKWAANFGGWIVVRTPVLDAVGDFAQSGLATIEASFRQVPWRPEPVAVVGLGCFVVCSLLLRRK